MASEESASGTQQLRLDGTAPSTRVGHCRHDNHDVYIGRGDHGGTHLLNTEVGDRGWLGNPFSVDDHGRVQCVERFRAEFEARLETDSEFREAVRDLHGAVLGCWCQHLDDDGPLCHGEVIAEWADQLAGEQSSTSTEQTAGGDQS